MNFIETPQIQRSPSSSSATTSTRIGKYLLFKNKHQLKCSDTYIISKEVYSYLSYLGKYILVSYPKREVLKLIIKMILTHCCVCPGHCSSQKYIYTVFLIVK